MPEFQDRVLKCVDCNAEFVFTAGEQQFFADKNFRNEPKRCKACKSKRQEGGGNGGHNKVETTANSSLYRRVINHPMPVTHGPPPLCRGVVPARINTATGAPF